MKLKARLNYGRGFRFLELKKNIKTIMKNLQYHRAIIKFAFLPKRVQGKVIWLKKYISRQSLSLGEFCVNSGFDDEKFYRWVEYASILIDSQKLKH